MHRPLPLACLVGLLAVAGAGAADQPQGDPYVPPTLRHAPAAPPAGGASLRQQALQKLKARFDQADVNHDGRLTQEEAKAGGLGFVVKHFERIDTTQRGAVSFDELKAFVQSRR